MLTLFTLLLIICNKIVVVIFFWVIVVLYFFVYTLYPIFILDYVSLIHLLVYKLHFSHIIYICHIIITKKGCGERNTMCTEVLFLTGFANNF